MATPHLRLINITADKVDTGDVEMSGNNMSGAFSSDGGSGDGSLALRVARLEEGVQSIKEGVGGIRSDISGLKASAINQTSMDLFRTELKGDQSALRIEISNLAATIRTEMSNLATSITTQQSAEGIKINTLSTDVAAAKGKIDSLPSMKWLATAFGITGTLVTAAVTVANFLFKHFG